MANREFGYRDGLSESNLPLRTSLILQGDNSFESGLECGQRLLRRKHPPTAIFAANDDMATGVLRAAHQLGVDVPTALSVAGFDDIPLAQQIYPALTTIRQPVRKMAETAAEILMSQVRSQPVDGESHHVEAELRIRESTGPA